MLAVVLFGEANSGGNDHGGIVIFFVSMILLI